MHKVIKDNPKKSISAIVLSVVTALSGAGYGSYDYITNVASKSYVKEQITVLSLEVLGVAIMKYEDELMGMDFLIETNIAKPMDRVNKKNLERRLRDLKEKRTRLENGLIDENSN